jgi:predicted aconitase
MQLNQYQQEMLEGKHGRGVRKAMEILYAMGEAREAEKMVEISYAHLMPPNVMFFL